MENPNGMYDLVMDEVLEDADKEAANKVTNDDGSTETSS